MTTYISFSETNNVSKGFDLKDVEVRLCERGFLSITGTDVTGTEWRLAIPVELLATAVAQAGETNG